MASYTECFVKTLYCEKGTPLDKHLHQLNNNETTFLDICRSPVLEELTEIPPFNLTQLCNHKKETVNPQCDYQQLDVKQLCSGVKLIVSGQWFLCSISCLMTLLWMILILKIQRSSESRVRKQTKLMISYLQLTANVCSFMMYMTLWQWIAYPIPMFLVITSGKPLDYELAGDLLMWINFYSFFQMAVDTSRYLAQISFITQYYGVKIRLSQLISRNEVAFTDKHIMCINATKTVVSLSFIVLVVANVFVLRNFVFKVLSGSDDTTLETFFRLIPRYLMITLDIAMMCLFVHCVYNIWQFLKNHTFLRSNEIMMAVKGFLGVTIIIS
jgi:hypothetical protein